MSQKTTPLSSTILNHKNNQPMAFQFPLINVHVIGIRIKKSYEVVFILYISASKVGFIYEDGGLTENQVLYVYKDVPENYNDIERYEYKNQEKLEILYFAKDNYVFIGERLVEKKK